MALNVDIIYTCCEACGCSPGPKRVQTICLLRVSQTSYDGLEGLGQFATCEYVWATRFAWDTEHTDNRVLYAWYGHSGLPGMAGRGMREESSPRCRVFDHLSRIDETRGSHHNVTTARVPSGFKGAGTPGC